MFIRDKDLFRLMGAAYKGAGLHMANHKGNMAMAGPGWAVEIKGDAVTKEIKGEILKLTGLLPDRGRQYLSTKEGNQEEILGTFDLFVYDLIGEGMKEIADIQDTRITIRGKFGTYRLYAGNVEEPVILDELMASLVSDRYANMHETLRGPYADRRRVFWHSDEMAMYLMTRDQDEIGERDEESTDLIRQLWAAGI